MVADFLIFCICVADDRHCLYRILCTGGHFDSRTESSDKRNQFGVMVFFRDYWGKLLTKTPAKIATLLFYLIYIAVAIWGCTKTNIGLKRAHLASDDSYMKTYYSVDDRYLQLYGPAVMVIVKNDMQFWKSSDRDRVEILMQKFENSTDVYHGRDLSVSWLREFVKHVDGALIDEDNFSERLDNFFAQRRFTKYRSDVKMHSDNVTISASRFFVYAKNTVSTARTWKVTTRAREIAESGEFRALNVTVFNKIFIYFDQYPYILPNTLQNIAMATGAMFMVSLLLLPHPLISLYVTFSIASICTGIMGSMALWNVDLDMISLINIIMCIGFCVDFSAHVSYAFMIAGSGSRNARMRTALYALGFPIAQGAVSTILAIVSLGFASVYIFRSFAKTMLLVTVFGALHGLVILPVALSLTGPASVVNDGTGERKKTRETLSPLGASAAAAAAIVVLTNGRTTGAGFMKRRMLR